MKITRKQLRQVILEACGCGGSPQPESEHVDVGWEHPDYGRMLGNIDDMQPQDAFALGLAMGQSGEFDNIAEPSIVEEGKVNVRLRTRGQHDRAGYASGLYEDDKNEGGRTRLDQSARKPPGMGEEGWVDSESTGTIKYTLPWTFDSTPPKITMPNGEIIEFLRIVQELQGKELHDPDDGGTFVFTLDNFRQSDEDTDEETAEHMIDVGVSEFYIQQWAETVAGYEAEDITSY